MGVAIRARRSELGISQEGLALEANLDRSYVGGVERGEHNIAIINLAKLAVVLKMSLAELCGRAGL